MTRMEAEAVMGGPPGNYCRPGEPLHGYRPREVADPEIRQWVGSTMMVWVIFDGRGRVSGKLIFGGRCLPEPEPSPFDRLRRLLSW
jgi:hypothetical protein